MRPRGGLTRRKGRRMRVVTGRADFALDGTKTSFPIPARPPMNPRFPIPVGRSVATATKRRALLDLQMPAVPGLKQLEVRFVMAIKAVVVAVVTAMPHHDVIMFLGHDHVSLGIQLELQRLVLLVAAVTVQARNVPSAAHQVRHRHPRRRRADKVRVHQRNGPGQDRVPPEIQTEGRRQPKKGQRHQGQNLSRTRLYIHRPYYWAREL